MGPRRWCGAFLFALLCLGTAQPPPGTSSLTFVFDITGSMFDDLAQVREGAKKIYQTVMSQRESLIYNYILVPFHDPYLGEIISTTDALFFQRQLNKVHVYGGGDCPEMTLAGIKKALEISLPGSFIYVFTDARSKDFHLEDQVLNLIQEKQSSVVFVMTGDCGNRTHAGFRTYEKIAAASFGQVFHLQKSDVRAVLEYVRHSVMQKKVHLSYEVRDKGGVNVRHIPVDKEMTELTLSLSGDKDDEDFLDIQLKDPKGRILDKTIYNKESGTIDLKNVKLIRLKEPMAGNWQVTTHSRLKHTLRVFGHGTIDFKYGFGARPLERIELARPRPVSGQSSYLMVNMTGLIPPGTVLEISLIDYYGSVLFSEPAKPTKTNPHVYFVGPFTPPPGLFFVQVKGVDSDDYEFQRIAPTAIGPVTVGGPRAYMAERTTAFANQPVNLSCTVESGSQYQLYWLHGDKIIGGPLFYSGTDTAVWSIPEVTQRERGDYSCHVVSQNGNHTARTMLETRESPPHIINLYNQSVVLGERVFLHCQTQSVSRTDIRWMRHGQPIQRNHDMFIYPNGTLVILRASRAHAGGYECQARNSGGMSQKGVIVRIVEKPAAVVSPKTVFFVAGTYFNISCIVSGDPLPKISWFFKGQPIANSRKHTIDHNNILWTRDPVDSDAGIYECRAQNSAGSAADYATVQMAIPPRVQLQLSKTMISRGDDVMFTCRVLEGNPPPRITWYRHGRELHYTRNEYTIVEGTVLKIQGAKEQDAGSYACIADNIAGKDQSEVKMNVGTAPSIMAAEDTVRVHIERQIRIPCRAVGVPPPTISWMRDGVPLHQIDNDRYQVLNDGELLIRYALLEDQTRFTCTARNDYGAQQRTVNVVVTGLVAPVIGHVPPEEQLISGEDLRLSCVVVMGNPKPELIWYKDGVRLEPTDSIVIEGGGASILLRNGDPKDEGRYTCAALSPAGNATININVQHIKRPRIGSMQAVELHPPPEYGGVAEDWYGSQGPIHVQTPDRVVTDGESVSLPCDVSGSPPPAVSWSIDGRAITPDSQKNYKILPNNTLIIYKMDKTTSGKYLCRALNLGGEAIQSTIVNLIAPPVLAPGQTSFNMIYGSSLSMPCEAEIGEPAPKITWYLNGTEFTEGIVDEYGNLLIMDLKPHHNGEFKCVAENPAGIDERLVSVMVHTPPKIPTESEVQYVTGRANETLVLPCPAESHPPPRRIWLRGEDEEMEAEKDGSLRIPTLTMKDDGTYQCIVSNLAGEDSVTYVVKVNEPPRITSDVPGTIDIVNGMALEIGCKANGKPQPRVAWEKDGFQVIPGGEVSVDSLGTLRIASANLSHAGQFKCTATNPAGTDSRTTNVIIQEPPVILPSTLGGYTSVEGDKVELRCNVHASPSPKITWYRKGVAIEGSDEAHTISSDGQVLTINEASTDGLSPITYYSCKATNPAGTVEKMIRLTVITAPKIPDDHLVTSEVVHVNKPFSLYCPVLATPIPEITWQLNDQPIAEVDKNVQLLDDHRTLRVHQARTTDAGVYKCTARNAAGESSKSFDVEIIVPLNIDESLFSRKITVNEGEEVTIGCPVKGVPDPNITWIVAGRFLGPSDVTPSGARLGDDGTTIVIPSASDQHIGEYHCVAQNKAGSLDVFVDLNVLTPPKLGPNEEIEIMAGRARTLLCDVKTGTDLEYTITWSKKGSSELPENIQIPLEGQRAFLMNVTLDNAGTYVCTARNKAGENQKKFEIAVLEAPEFTEKDFEQNVRVISGAPLHLYCGATGHPSPTIIWKRNGEDIVTPEALLSDSHQRLSVGQTDIHEAGKQHSRYTCHVSNSAGTITRDFFIETVAPPDFTDTGDRIVVEVNEGQTFSLSCPVVTNGDMDIQWRRQGRTITDTEAAISEDRSQLLIRGASKEHEDVFTCIAKNQAGEAAREFQVLVNIPPKVKGALVETVEVVEGSPMTLNCDFEGSPTPTVIWDKDRKRKVPARSQLLNENKTLAMNSVESEQAGDYRCSIQNKVGSAEKTFKVIVVEKPSVAGAEEVEDVEVLLGRPHTFDCPVRDDSGVQRSWTKHELPIPAEQGNVQVMADGRHLHVNSANKDDEGTYTCIAKNKAGETHKNYKLKVLVPPKIINPGGEFTVIENNSLVLPCEVEGDPMPKIVWRKDNKPIKEKVSIFNDGQQLKIRNAGKQHKGTYACQATSKVSSAAISFDVDVITRPAIAAGVKDTLEVVEGETAVFSCPVGDQVSLPSITWLRDFKPVKQSDDPRLVPSQNNRKLHLHNATLRDEGGYSCRMKNDAGETRVDFKLLVNIPPKIVMLDKDKDRTVVENKTVTLSCPATGKPEPTIQWFKDGQRLHEANISQFVNSASLVKNEIKIARVNAKDFGRFTCEAKNKVGVAEQDVVLFVMTPPRIERDGIPSVVEEVAKRAVTISCPVHGKPTPTVTWLKNGRPLSDEVKIKTSANGQKLYFLSLSKEETDRYTCIGRNPAGEDKRDFNVKLLEAPSFIGPNIVTRVQTNEGRPSVLNCPASGSPPPAITWLRDGLTLSPGPRHVFLDNGRQLQISNTRPEDQARYTCIATNSVGSDDLETTLEVVRVPKIVGDAHEKLEVVENGRIDLLCEVNETDPSMETEWQKAGETIGSEQLRENQFLQLPSSGRRLHLLSARVPDAGRYTCVVRTPAGEARKTFELKVLVPPSIGEANSSPDIQTVVPGQTLKIDCDADGNPPPEVEWLHNGQPIDENAVRFSNDRKSVTVDDAGDGHDGRYTCKVKNTAGEAQRDFIVRLTGPPVFDQGIEYLDVRVSDSITLVCKVSSGAVTSVKWLINGKEVDNGEYSSTVQIDDRQVQIINTRLSDAGQYVCVASNSGGEARKTFELSVSEAPRFLDTTNIHPSIILGRPLTLDCSVSGTPKPSITWFKDGEKLNVSLLDPERFSFMNDRQQLHIEEATADEAGRYSCLAENKQGRKDKDLTVEILKPPKMEETELPKEVVEGQPITLHCPIQDFNADISWTKNGVAITTSQRLQMSVNRDKLFVMDAEPSDTAQYKCIAKNEAGEDAATFDLSVSVAPKILTPAFRSIEKILNQTVEIDCDATGVPTPTIQWYLDGKQLIDKENMKVVDNGRILKIFNVTDNEKGRYSCKAENKVGKAEADTFLSIIETPRALMVSDELKVIAGHGITIRCEILGNPAPEVSWLKNGQPYNNNLLQSQTYIHIREASADDAARYTCVAVNRAGEHRASTQLQVLSAPRIENEERVLQVKEGTHMSIDCTASGSPPIVYTWHRDGVLIPDVNSTNLEIPAANPTDAGKYTCVARNEAGVEAADFAVDVLIKPRFKDIENIVDVIESKTAVLKCKVEGHPTPSIKWLKGGRPIEGKSNVILSPRGEKLMILKATRSDAGSYSCVAKNAAGEAENQFTVNVLIPPHIEETIDQAPKIVQGQGVVLQCPVLGNPEPEIEWTYQGEKVQMGGRYSLVGGKHLQISDAEKADEGDYKCNAVNAAGESTSDYKLEVIAPPKFKRIGETVYEVVIGETAEMDCEVETQPRPQVDWFRGEEAIYMEDTIKISPDGMKISINKVSLSDAGKYRCKATNEAGSTEIDLILKVFVPPKIDRSNIIGNPLAIVDKNIVLECPVSGIPQPSVMWTKDGVLIDFDSDSRLKLAQNNQTLSVNKIAVSDQGRYSCVATNKGGEASEDFKLEVLTPPVLETNKAQQLLKREGDSLTLSCPVLNALDGTEPADIAWIKDGRPIDSKDNLKDGHMFSSDGRRLTITSSQLSDAGSYMCVASNRAGESALDFSVEILSPPVIDVSKNEQSPRVTLGHPVVLFCPVSGHPFPTIKWSKDGVELDKNVPNIRIRDNGQELEIFTAEAAHKGIWTCTAVNDAGSKDLDIDLDVWVPPQVSVHSDDPIKAIGDTITIECNVSGNPMPRVSWTKGGQPLLLDNSFGQRYRISLRGHRLDIPSLERADVGTYTCLAENEAGTNEASIHVDVLVPPLIIRDNIDMSQRAQTGHTLALTCEATGKPEPTLRWFVNNTEISNETEGIHLGTDNKYIQIANISLEARGDYKCLASNVAGNDTMIYAVDVVQSPSILNGGTQQVVEGEMATMECGASGYPEPVIKWLRNGVRLETGLQGVRYLADGRILKVVESRSSDSGIYLCEATNEAGTAQQAYTLEVLVAPVIVSKSNQQSAVPQGQPFSLKCGVKGYPEPTITWTLNDYPVESGKGGSTIAEDGTLFVENAIEKIYNYKCVAKNDAGTDEVEYTVKTIVAPVLTKEGLGSVNTTDNEPTVLTCDVEGDTPSIQWFKNGIPLATSPKYEFSEDKSQVTILKSTLNDEGEYSCVAKNSAGNVTQKTQLYVGIPPRITDGPRRVVVKDGELAELWCEAVGVPQPHIVWLREGVPLANTAVDDHSDSRKTSALFKSISPDQAGVYTCKAENWAGRTDKDVDLVVLIPPAVYPEKANETVLPRVTAILTCNVTGIPEPVVSWVRAPNTEITENEKYKFLGTQLAINNVLVEDEGFYHCVAKSEAGQALGSRRLIVTQPQNATRRIWVECDEDGRPIKTTYISPRGDLPDDDNALLPWKETLDTSLNTTDGVVFRCMPGPRGPRASHIVPHMPPTFIHTPKNTTLLLGQMTHLTCSAEGPPVPEIRWKKDGTLINKDVDSGYSTMNVTMDNPDDAGTYTCVAKNSVGESETNAEIRLAEPPEDGIEYDYEDGYLPSTLPTSVNRQVTVLNCMDKRVKQTTWYYRDRPVNDKIDPVVLLNNGSLVVLDSQNQKLEVLSKYSCRVGNRIKQQKMATVDVVDAPPVVTVTPQTIHLEPGTPVIVDCLLEEGQPLTTTFQWMKNNIPLISDPNVQILPNNSLHIIDSAPEDAGRYTCRGANTLGSSYDNVDIIYQGDDVQSINDGDGITNENLFLLPITTPSPRDEQSPFDVLMGARLTDVVENKTDTPRKYTISKDIKFSTGERVKVEQEIDETKDSPIVQQKIEGKFPDLAAEAIITLASGSKSITEPRVGTIIAIGKADMLVGNESISMTIHDEYRFNSTEHKVSKGRSMQVEVVVVEEAERIKTHVNQEADECADGFELGHDGECHDIDECSVNETICDPSFECVNIEGSYDCEPICDPGFRPQLDGDCVDVNECEKRVCPEGEYCVNTEGNYTCYQENPCDNGFVYNAISDMCEDINECDNDNICAPSLKCVNQLGSFVCLCANGTPPKNGKCSSGKKASNTNHRHHKCDHGYHWDNVTLQCVDYDECAHEMPCEWQCVNTEGSYYCQCPTGYYLDDNKKCKDVNECSGNATICDGTGGAELCFNTYGGYACLAQPCPTNYTLVGESECHHDCHECHKPVVALSFAPVHAHQAQGAKILKFTAFDKNSKVVNDTTYTMSIDIDATKEEASTDAGVYEIHSRHGQAEILSTGPLPSGETNHLRVFAESQRNADSHFLIHIHVGKHKFG